MGITHHQIVTFSFNENLTVKNNKIDFLGRKLRRSGHVNKIYAKNGTMYNSSPELHRGKALKIYYVNDLFSLFPYYDFGENYQGNDPNNLYKHEVIILNRSNNS